MTITGILDKISELILHGRFGERSLEPRSLLYQWPLARGLGAQCQLLLLCLQQVVVQPQTEMGLCCFLCQGRCGVVMKLSDEERKLPFLECLSSLDFILFIKTFFNSFLLWKMSFKPFKMYSSVGSIQYIHSVVQPSSLSVSRTFSSQEEAPLDLPVTLLSSQPLSTTTLPSVSVDLLVLGIAHKWNHVICGLLLLASVNLA